MRQPHIDIARFDFPDLSQVAGRPIALDSADDESFPLEGFRLLMLNRFQITVAQLSERQLPLRAVNLPLLILECGKLRRARARSVVAERA